MIHTFKQLNIPQTNRFVGTKVQVDDILNQEIVVHDYKIEPSKQKENTECLHMQIEFNDKKHVYFTGSKNLIDTIKQISKEKFPFKTIITRESRFLQFT